MDIKIVPYDCQLPYFDDALRIYCIVWGRDYHDSLIFFRNYGRLPDFCGYIALVGNHAVGFAFGTRSECGQWWHDKVAQHVGKRHIALQDAWVLTEIAVLAEYRNSDIGGMLHDAVIEQQTHQNVLLSTQVSNIGARRFYERRGWSYLHKGFAFNRGSQPYVVMHRNRKYAIANPATEF